jgi:hypothetical protein
VAAGVAGLFIWPLWFGMDFQGAAGKEAAALQSRQQYLATLAEQRRCGAGATAFSPPPAPTPPVAPTTPQPAPLAATTPAPSRPAAVASARAGETVSFPTPVNRSTHSHWTVGIN